MRSGSDKIWLFLALTVLVSACVNREPNLLKAGARGNGPDEFAVLPAKPLQTPVNYSVLPDPTPGGSNITDVKPNADAITALGGYAAVLTRAGIPTSDAGLLNYTRRYGVTPAIRQELADADLAFRRRRGALSFLRLFGNNRYFTAYRAQSLDQYRELERLRAAGIKTPTAPPRTAR